MKIWHSKYQLSPKTGSKVEVKFRKGSLLRIRFDDGAIGYADLCPFSEMGDRPLEHELRALSRGKPESLAERALYFARMDADARTQKKSLYDKNIKIKNHFLITDLIHFNLEQLASLEAAGYTEFKVSVGRSLTPETEKLKLLFAQLSSRSKVRVDFNGSLTSDGFSLWFQKNQGWLRPKIEYFEDPFLYDPVEWLRLSEKYQIRFALDQLFTPTAAPGAGVQVLVIKPARQNVNQIMEWMDNTRLKLVVTHYTDFPLGQICALIEAQKLYRKFEDRMLTCGVQYHDIYQGFVFQDQIRNDGPYVLPPDGYGLGFDRLLEDLDWEDIV